MVLESIKRALRGEPAPIKVMSPEAEERQSYQADIILYGRDLAELAREERMISNSLGEEGQTIPSGEEVQIPQNQ